MTANQEKMMESTITELVPDIMPKILEDNSLQGWHKDVHRDILSVCVALGRLTVVRMTVSLKTMNSSASL